MFPGATSAMYLMKEVLPLCRAIQSSYGQSAVALWAVIMAGGRRALEVGA